METCSLAAGKEATRPRVIDAELAPDGGITFPVWEKAMAKCRSTCGSPAEPGDERWDPPLRAREQEKPLW
jgi:hypothetical protein